MTAMRVLVIEDDQETAGFIAKGLGESGYTVDLANDGKAGLVQAVGERVRHQFDRPWGEQPRVSRLVVIAEHDDVDATAFRKVLDVA